MYVELYVLLWQWRAVLRDLKCGSMDSWWGALGSPEEQALGIQLSGAFRFHRRRLSRRWLVKFEQRTGK